MLPALVLLLALTLYPVVYGAWISTFNKHSFFPEQTFVGMSNYAYVLTDAEFWVSVRLGAIYALSSIMLQIVLGVAAALVVTPKTVEAHLGRTYRKLGIRRRSELSARLAKQQPSERSRS